jgi:hypothetical protein
MTRLRAEALQRAGTDQTDFRGLKPTSKGFVSRKGAKVAKKSNPRVSFFLCVLGELCVRPVFRFWNPYRSTRFALSEFH